MKYCVPSPQRNVSKWHFLILTIILAAFAVFLIVFMIIALEFHYLLLAYSVIIFTYVLPALLQTIRFADRKYQITNEGIRVSDKGKSIYSWDEIYGIGIYPYDANGSLTVCDKVICCLLQPPTKKIRERLLTNDVLYGERNQDKLLIIYYNETVYEELRSVYPGEISDYFTGSCLEGEWRLRK